MDHRDPCLQVPSLALCPPQPTPLPSPLSHLPSPSQASGRAARLLSPDLSTPTLPPHTQRPPAPWSRPEGPLGPDSPASGASRTRAPRPSRAAPARRASRGCVSSSLCSKVHLLPPPSPSHRRLPEDNLGDPSSPPLPPHLCFPTQPPTIGQHAFPEAQAHCAGSSRRHRAPSPLTEAPSGVGGRQARGAGLSG